MLKSDKCHRKIMNQNQLIDKFNAAYRSFPKNYHDDFDNFWVWKHKIESKNEHILDKNHLDSTHNRICSILRGWQYKRGPKCDQDPLYKLKQALNNISDDYDEMRNLTLFDIKQFDMKQFQRIWQELGDVKIVKTSGNSENPLVMSVCKPLMLLWGQTLAFDTRVRGNYYDEYKYSFLRKNRWSSQEWLCSLFLSYSLLEKNKEFTEYLKKHSLGKYGKDCSIPYGRLLDIYYF